MGITHAQRIQAALDRALESHPELDEYFDASRAERFFVKNLERVQGDERDAIILSIGYAKDRTGRLPYRFGPLLTDGGKRRLNVAITRARDELYLTFPQMRLNAGYGDMFQRPSRFLKEIPNRLLEEWQIRKN